jgi:hypothetical protein
LAKITIGIAVTSLRKASCAFNVQAVLVAFEFCADQFMVVIDSRVNPINRVVASKCKTSPQKHCA